jgi:hypothetical protein
MSATDIISELPRLTEAELRLVLDKVHELVGLGGNDRSPEQAPTYRAVELRDRGIGEAQARDLRSRLKTFAGDWDRPEASIYDEDPAR